MSQPGFSSTYSTPSGSKAPASFVVITHRETWHAISMGGEAEQWKWLKRAEIVAYEPYFFPQAVHWTGSIVERRPSQMFRAPFRGASLAI
jgi:hypothetical protein